MDLAPNEVMQYLEEIQIQWKALFKEQRYEELLQHRA